MPLMLANLEVGILFVLAVSSLGVYGIVLAGWSSNSKYPFLGGIRSSAQMISYELAMGLSLLPVFLWVSVPGTGAMGLSLVEIVNSQNQGAWLLLVQPLSALIFLILRSGQNLSKQHCEKRSLSTSSLSKICHSLSRSIK